MDATYIAGNQFSVAGDQTALLVAGRRVKADCGVDGYKYGTVESSTYGAATTVTLTASVLTSNLASIQYGISPGSTGSLPKHDHTDDGKGGDMTQFVKHSLATAANDFLVASGVGVFIKKTLAEVKSILGLGTAAYTASTDYAVAAKGVTNGDSHDHAGGDGAQIDHGGLGGLSDDDHTQYVKHSLATAANDFLIASGAGAFIKKTLAEALTILGKAAASGLASLDGSSKVVQDPANATSTATASKIPIADGSGKLDTWITDATTSAKGKVELATPAELETGSSESLAATPKAVSDQFVKKSLFDANTMLYATADNTPAALAIAASRIVGRKSSGDIVALTGAEALAIIGGGSYTITAKTSTYTVTAANCNGLLTLTNGGAAGAIDMDLPAGAANYRISFRVDAAQYLQIDPNGTEVIKAGSDDGIAGGYLRSNVVGDSVTLEWSVTLSKWMVVALVGTGWNLETA